MSFLADLPRPFFVLAPMDDVTDTVFRQVVASCSPPNLYFTEFVNVDGLQSAGRDKLLHKLAFTSSEQPLIAQIWGKNPDNFYKTIKELVDGTLADEANAKLGLQKGLIFSGVDINMGCPDKTICKNGCCAALINNRGLTDEILTASREGVAGKDFPVSVKTRLGFSEADLSWHEFLLSQKLNMLTIHGRTAKQLSKVPADWNLIGRVREMRDSLSPTTLIVGNGDILNRAQGLSLAKKHKLDGVMIGRGVFDDPFVFSKNSPWTKMPKHDRLNLYQKHVRLFERTYSGGERKSIGLNKFCKIYINGFDGAKELRERLMSAKGTQQLLDLISEALK